MPPSWCKVASNLDSHPKVRRAGRCGREVFLFALRRNAEPGNPVPGRVPADELAPWYLADQLMMPECDAVTGVTAAVTAGLLAEDGDYFVICGWGEEWGKAAQSGRERTARWRENNKLHASVTSRDGRDVTDRHGDARDALEEKRSEEKRLEEKRSHTPRKRGEGTRKSPEVPIPADWEPTPEHAALANERGVSLGDQARQFRAHADTHDRRCVRWNAAFTQWLLKSRPDQQPRRDGLAYALAVANGEIP